MSAGAQTFLFLQGHPSSFARHLGDALEAAGCRVLRINFCFGDWAYWLGRPAVNYRGTFANWDSYLRDFIERENVTDILYYGDCKPYHRVAADVANALDIRAMTYEFGYLRPDWITLERHGMSTRSHFPNDPQTIREIGTLFGPADMKPKYSHSIATELANEVFYNLSSYFAAWLYFNYNADRYYNPIVEYVTGIPKQFAIAANNRKAEATIAKLSTEAKPFYLFPLQLQSDYQLRYHAAFEHQSDAIRLVIESFAREAPRDAHLVFKCHPLDNNGEGWPKYIEQAAGRAGITDRVHYIDGGNLNAMLSQASGCVLINSTVGMFAISIGCPTKVLGGALFDVDGLTHQGSLDSFWKSGMKPDPELAEALVRALAGTIQVKGNFFSSGGQAAAIPVFVERLTSMSVNGDGAFVSPPPRLEDARIAKI
jgi:capsular polysaccharide export protein